MQSLKLKISVNVIPHGFKNQEWLVGRFSPFSSFSGLYPVQKYLIPMGFNIGLIKTDMYELKWDAWYIFGTIIISLPLHVTNTHSDILKRKNRHQPVFFFFFQSHCTLSSSHDPSLGLNKLWKYGYRCCATKTELRHHWYPEKKKQSTPFLSLR